MANKAKRFVYFANEETFKLATQGNEYDFTSLVVVGDIQKIWNRGQYLDGKLSDYLKKSDAALQFQPLGDYVESDELENYIDKEALQEAIKDFVTKEELEQAIEEVDVTEQLSEYEKTSDVESKISSAKSELEGKISEVEGKIPSLEGYATEEYVGKEVKKGIDSIVDGATEAMDTLKEVEEALKESGDTVTALNQAIGKKADKTYVDEQIEGLDEKYQPVGDYLTSVPDTYATKTYVDEQVDGLATEDYVDGKVEDAVDGLASEEFVNSAISTSENKFYTKEEVDDMWEWGEY